MTATDYNARIWDYVHEKRNDGALMLSAPWGTGKSFYINRALIPFLQDKGVSPILVSVYGMHSVDEISKAIYLEIRASKFRRKSEPRSIATIIGRTIVKGVAGYFNIPLDIKDSDLKRLYSSIDLKDKLIILEDIERPHIDIKNLLGYVNGLTENDGAKVLLVANEREIRDVDSYERIKEKTVFDTIAFFPDFLNSIADILREYGEDFSPLNANNDSFVEEIMGTLISCKNNFRTLIFAIQKTRDLFQEVKDLDESFVRKVFMGVLLFSIKLKTGNENNLVWVDDTSASELGSEQYPLYEFAYDYITRGVRPSVSDVSRLTMLYRESNSVNQAEKEFTDAFNILEQYYIHTESEVVDALERINSCIKRKPDIGIKKYRSLANSLAALRDCLREENQPLINGCKSSMVAALSNLEISASESRRIQEMWMFAGGVTFETNKQQRECKEFQAQLLECLTCSPNRRNRNKAQIDVFIESLQDIDGLIIRGNTFKDIDIDAFVDELFAASPKVLEQIRLGIIRVYQSQWNAKQYLASDLGALTKIRNSISTRLADSNRIDDVIVAKQLCWLLSNIEDAISKLEA